MKSIKRAMLTLALALPFFLATVISTPAVELGSKAPDFELSSTQGGKLKLSSLAGKKNVIIQFYVLDFTPT